MVNVRRRELIAGFLGTLLLSACVHPPYYGTPYHPPRSYYEYYYYPSIGVYFHYSSGNYYYRSGTQWVRSRTLPSQIHLHSHDRRVIYIERGDPYRYYDQHHKTYKPYPKYHPDPRYDRSERDHNYQKYKQYHPTR